MPKKNTTFKNFDDTYNMEISQENLKEACIRVYKNDSERTSDTAIILSKQDITDLIETLTELERNMQS